MLKIMPRMAVSTGIPFSPLSISGLKIWLKADAINLNDGDPVGTWPDSTGLGNDATQSTGANKPIYHTNIMNGYPAVQFDGLAQYMSWPTGIGGVQNSLFIVTQPTANTASQNDHATIIIGNVAHSVGIFARLTANFWGAFKAVASADLSSGNALVSGTNYLLQSTTTDIGPVCFLYQRGVQVATASDATSGSGSISQIGNDTRFSPRYYKGYITEILIYDSVLSSTNRASVETYLISKYAL